MSRVGQLTAIAALFISSCSPTPTAAPTPAPTPQVSVGPSALPFASELAQGYQEQRGVLPFDLVPMATEAGLEAAESGEALFHIDYAPVPDGWFAVPLGWEGIAVVVNPEVEARDLDTRTLAELFSGRMTSWESVTGEEETVQLVIPPPGDRLFDHFTGLIGMAQDPPLTAILAPVPEATLAYVGEQAAALGFLPYHYGIPQELRALRVDGTLPAPSTIRSGRYVLRLQVIAMAPDEPDTIAIEWLGWAQNRLAETSVDPP